MEDIVAVTISANSYDIDIEPENIKVSGTVTVTHGCNRQPYRWTLER